MDVFNLTWYNYVVPNRGTSHQPTNEGKKLEAVAIAQNKRIAVPATSRTRVANASRRVRKKLFKWAFGRSDIRPQMELGADEIVVQIRPMRRGITGKSGPPQELLDLQKTEFKEFVRKIAGELGLRADEKPINCSLGYAWLGFSLTFPQHGVH